MKLIFISVIYMTIILNCYAQQWNFLNEGFIGRDFDFINEKVGWIAGDGKILKTIDGGITWDSYPTDKDWSFRKIDFIDKLTGWASVELTKYSYTDSQHTVITIQKTEDGGRKWFAQGINDYDWSPYSEPLQAVNDSVVYFSINDDDYDKILIFKTIDGGETWNNISPGTSTGKRFNSIWFQDCEKGVLIGTVLSPYHKPSQGFILKTDNGGETWMQQVIPEFSEIYDLQIINDTTAYFLGRKDIYDKEDYSFCKTTNFFNSWNLVYQHPANCKISSFFYLNDSNIYAHMRDSLWTMKLVKSTDGGSTWQETHNNGWLSNQGKIYFLNENDGFIMIQSPLECPGSFILKTSDSGQNWSYRYFSYNLYDIQLLNANAGFIHGYQGLFHGGSWDYISKITEGGNFQINFDGELFYFLDDRTGFLLSDEYYYPCFKTNDGGINWNQVEISRVDSVSFQGNDFYFLNINKGWIVGSGIYETTDNGEHWDLIRTYPGTEDYKLSLYSVHGCDTIAWAVGEQGLMVKYTPPNPWQQQLSVTDLPLTDVFFSDTDYGWVAGGYLNDQGFQSILLMTKNCGEIWLEKRFDKFLINDLYFADSLHGWIVGEDTTGSGMILESLDGGENWDPVVENLSAPLNAISFKDSVGWAVGYNGLILRTENGSTWIDQNTGQKHPSKYQLYQNYPNPFNPKTVIRYTVGAQNLVPLQHVDLSIYNSLGQKVATLVNKKQAADSYQVQWDASGLSSGVYLYRLQAGDHVQTKKMIFMK